MNMLKNLLVTLAAACIGAGPVYAEVCKLKGTDVVSFAHQRGFQFFVEQEGDAACQLSSHRAGGSGVLAPNGSGACVFHFFANGNLANGWRFADVLYSNRKGSYEVVKAPARGASDLQMTVRLQPNPSGASTFLISRINLEGDDCDNWRSAF